MTSSASTIVGLPAEAAPSPAADAGGPASLDDARARKREQDRAAKQRQRARERGAEKPAASAAPSTSTPGEEAPRPQVKFRGGDSTPATVYVDRATLEQLATGAATAVASMTGDGRAFLLANLRMPGTGRTLAGDVGHHADVVLMMQGIQLTPEATAYANLVASLGVVAAVLSSLPKMDMAAAAAALPELQKNVDAALGGLTPGGRH